MKILFELNLSKKQIVAILLVLIAFSTGSYKAGEIVTENRLSMIESIQSPDADFNKMIIAGLATGFCEKLGLSSSVFWQQDSEGNTFGVPICVGVNANG